MADNTAQQCAANTRERITVVFIVDSVALPSNEPSFLPSGFPDILAISGIIYRRMETRFYEPATFAAATLDGRKSLVVFYCFRFNDGGYYVYVQVQ